MSNNAHKIGTSERPVRNRNLPAEESAEHGGEFDNRPATGERKDEKECHEMTQSKPVPESRRPRKRDEIPERLVSTARELFCHNGIAETGVQEILKEADVSRMALYNHFGSKKALVLAALRLEGEEWRDWFFEAIEASGRTPRKRLENIFRVLEEWFSNEDYYGCSFINAIAEGSKSDSDYRALALEHKSQVKGYLRQLAWDAGCSDPEAFVDRLLIIIDGLIVCRLVNRHASLLEHSESMLQMLLNEHITGDDKRRSAA